MRWCTGGEREIGTIFDGDGGPEVAQQRVESYLLGRGVNDTQSWGMGRTQPSHSFTLAPTHY